MRNFRVDPTSLLLILAGSFIAVNLGAVSLWQHGQLTLGAVSSFLVWAVLSGVVYGLLIRYKPQYDRLILVIVLFLMGWGLVEIERLAANFATRQLIWVIVGLLALSLTAIWPRNLNLLYRYRYTLLIAGLLLLAATLLLGVNPSGFGARLWLPIPIPFVRTIYFQPSELLKLLLVVFLASYFTDRESLLQLRGRNGRWGPLPYLGPLLLMWGFCMVLLIWQEDLGAATLYFFLFVALLYLATGERLYVLIGLVLLLAAAVFAYFLFDVVALRIETWWNPWPEASDRAYQIVQSLYALAAGGSLGAGVGQGFPDYIPVVHSDFVFAAIAEEWGLLGAMVIIISFLVLVYRGLRIAMLSRWTFSRYLAAGISITLGAQTILILGGVTKLLPLTGVTLPFVSYGGSSLLVSSLMIGLLLYLSAEARQT